MDRRKELSVADLKLPKLPDRTPVKLTITLGPDLRQALDDYAAAYEGAYGQREQIAELIPAIVTSFLASDRAFHRSRKA